MQCIWANNVGCVIISLDQMLDYRNQPQVHKLFKSSPKQFYTGKAYVRVRLARQKPGNDEGFSNASISPARKPQTLNSPHSPEF